VSTLPPTLVRFESQLEQAVELERRRRPRRLTARVGAVAAATALALTVAVAWPGSDRPASAVERAEAVLTPADGSVLHMVQVSETALPDGNIDTARIESWQLTEAPHDSREVLIGEDGSVWAENATVDGRPESWSPLQNTVFVMPPDAEIPDGSWVPPTPGAADLVERMQTMLASGDAREEGPVDVDGREAIRIVTGDGSRSLLVDAATYEPIEWTATSDDGVVVTTRVETFETLPATADTLSLLSLREQHPDAAVESSLEIPAVR
jgi:hypothetical protein